MSKQIENQWSLELECELAELEGEVFFLQRELWAVTKMLYSHLLDHRRRTGAGWNAMSDGEAEFMDEAVAVRKDRRLDKSAILAWEKSLKTKPTSKAKGKLKKARAV